MHGSIVASTANPVQIALATGNRRFVGASVAFVVDPAYRHLIAGLAAPEAEMHERIFRYRGPPLRREHRLSGVSNGHVLDEVRGDGIAPCVLALARLHLVAHQHPHLDLVAHHIGADAHRVCHVYPPHPPMVTLISFAAWKYLPSAFTSA